MMASVEDSAEKPDPTRVYSDNDMNSLAPFDVSTSFNNYKPERFKSGWRELRIPVKLPTVIPEGKVASIEFVSAICDRVEAYVGGELIYECEPEYKAPVIIPMDMSAGSEFELCVLVKARDDMISGNGFAIGVSMSFEDK